MKKYQRFRNKLVIVGREYLYRPIIDPIVLEEQFKIHETPMDLEEVQKFVGRFCDRAILPDDTRIRFVIVPQKSNPNKIYIVGLSEHSLMDGMSSLHILS